MEQAVTELAPQIGVVQACAVLGVPRSGYYRRHARATAAAPPPPRPPRASHRALSAAEQAHILDVLRSDRFVDQSPRQVYATLLDEGTYLCAWSTMYRLLRATGESTRRRDIPRRTAYRKPELLARRPNQLWSWDITKLKGTTTWTYFYLYVIIDVFSRYVVGWMIAPRESAALAEELIGVCCAREGIQPGQLTIHADRGSAMTSNDVAALLVDLGVAKSHSRPHVSNDNPFSEAQFKTVKYHPITPDRFGSIEDARAWAHPLFHWYNQEHHHTGLALLTPAQVHHGRTGRVLAARRTVLAAAYAIHPERFVRGKPEPAAPPDAVWINPPASTTLAPADRPNLSVALPDAGAVSRGDSAAALDAAPVNGYPADGSVRPRITADAP